MEYCYKMANLNITKSMVKLALRETSINIIHYMITTIQSHS